MPKVGQSYLDAVASRSWMPPYAIHQRRFRRNLNADIVTEAGLSTGSIYRYFASKNEIVVAVCEQGTERPTALTLEAVTDFLEHVRALARDKGHARLVAQIYAEAALSRRWRQSLHSSSPRCGEHSQA